MGGERRQLVMGVSDFWWVGGTEGGERGATEIIALTSALSVT